jgi:hypothetical protein
MQIIKSQFGINLILDLLSSRMVGKLKAIINLMGLILRWKLDFVDEREYYRNNLKCPTIT